MGTLARYTVEAHSPKASAISRKEVPIIDEDVFARTSRDALPSLYRISLSILRHTQDAQDAVQQGLLRAWEARNRAWSGAERAWITQIVINECRNIQRRRMRVTPVAAFPDAAWTPPDTALRDAVDALPERFRVPLLLKYMENMSEEETARALRVSRAAVKSRLHRARAALGRLLEEEGSL